jgi:hypothetical protein
MFKYSRKKILQIEKHSTFDFVYFILENILFFREKNSFFFEIISTKSLNKQLFACYLSKKS